MTDPLQPALRSAVPAIEASRVVDEQGQTLEENSHPGVDTLTREEIVRILSADLSP